MQHFLFWQIKIYLSIYLSIYGPYYKIACQISYDDTTVEFEGGAAMIWLVLAQNKQ